MSNGKTATILALGETGFGRSEMPAALEAETRRLVGGDQMLVLNAAEHGVPAGMIGRLIGHPAGYRTYGDDQDTFNGVPKGLLASLALGMSQRGDQPCVFFADDDPVTVN